MMGVVSDVLVAETVQALSLSLSLPLSHTHNYTTQRLLSNLYSSVEQCVTTCRSTATRNYCKVVPGFFKQKQRVVNRERPEACE